VCIILNVIAGVAATITSLGFFDVIAAVKATASWRRGTFKCGGSVICSDARFSRCSPQGLVGFIC
jgi:hypothetical protein